jgi:hypothetical protein
MFLSVEGRERADLADSEAVKSGFAYEDNENGYENSKKFIYYTVEYDEDGALHCYLCDSDGEMTGGDFHPASALCSANDLLFFGTSCGDLCCFNTDKRDENGNIDVKYYTFDNRRYTSGFVTISDNCSIPHLTKTTVKRSLCALFKNFGAGKIKVGVHTDRVGWKTVAETNASVFAFDDVEFDNFTFHTERRTIIPIYEKEKRWVEKQYRVFSDEYKRPFGIFNLSYRYKVAGRIKKCK